MPPSNSKPCHNCRRRRLRCDRSWPTCHKCAVSGQDCLGYGKVFVWTQGIDSQGNVNPPPARRGADEGGGPAGGQQSQQQQQQSQQQLNQIQLDQHQQQQLGHQQQQLDHQQQQPLDQQDLPLPSDTIPTSTTSPPVGLALTDPLFQDLDRNSRYYLAHFADRVCKDLVVRDTPESNPFRELLPLTRNHPLLLQILIATSAIHWSNIFRPNHTIPAGLTDPGGHLSLLRSKDLVTRQALIDALTAKQKAMSHLRDVLETLDPAGSEVALAAMHFFIKFDLIDLDKSDGHSWKAHLEGATSIMALLSPDSSTNSSSRMLRDRVISDCFIYHILGSTLASGGLAARIARHAFEFLPVMKRVELTSYLSCPPEILQIILSASQLSHETPSWADSFLPAADEALALIDQALTLDIPAWAAHLQRHGNVTDLESRVHLASAHRSAACLYILQALPLVRAVRPVDTDVLVSDILSNLAFIGEDDPYFKATSWPTFIAGAETRDPEKRTWSLTRLLAIWEICPWGYLFTAIEMLKATWALQDASGETQVNWLRDLRGLGFEHLIV
ncbi:fungal-specific transcription factor domain-containing protein [Dactylonectria macrodidyma]|uniref:Fungal-specific transcription factor domain-containing protein n=1 Tax=Dactylonectria macrodidyma TaxID=307937 RepID=A0A9P9EBX2_9HYPO|nr:fungal-specific transcription factor domain-containing protein [Dactylonectria macrodidyma]